MRVQNDNCFMKFSRQTFVQPDFTFCGDLKNSENNCIFCFFRVYRRQIKSAECTRSTADQ